jgi:hypothetical protein
MEKIDELFIVGKKRERAIRFIATLPQDGRYSIHIKTYKKNRSLAQNNLYWKWITIMAQHEGTTVDAMHKYMKKTHLGFEVVEIFGERIAILPSTSKLNVVEMRDYMEQIEIFANMEMDLILPRPEDVFEKENLQESEVSKVG